jgi:hypothetical protein
MVSPPLRRFGPRLLAVVCLTLAFAANLAFAGRTLAAGSAPWARYSGTQSPSIALESTTPTGLQSAVGSGGWARSGVTITRAGSATDAEPAVVRTSAAATADRDGPDRSALPPAVVVAPDAADSRVPIVILSLVLGCAGLVLLRLARAGRETTGRGSHEDPAAGDPRVGPTQEALVGDPLLAAVRRAEADPASGDPGESPRWVQRLEQHLVTPPGPIAVEPNERVPEERDRRLA